jgi:hypothetical protein
MSWGAVFTDSSGLLSNTVQIFAGRRAGSLIINLMAINLFRSGPRRFTAALVGAALLATGLAAAFPGTASAAAGCSVKYSVTNFWGTGLTAGLTFTPPAAVTSWTVDFDVADQQLVTNTFNASFVQTGTHVRLTNASFDGSVAAGGTSASVGVLIYTNPTLTNIPASNFSVNGQVCSSTVSPYVVPGAYRAVVPEGGSLGIPIRLSQAPTANIVLTIYSPTGFSVSASSLTFTPADWDVPQLVTVTSAQDADAVNQTGTLSLQQQNWAPQQYTGAWLGLTQQDNDA